MRLSKIRQLTGDHMVMSKAVSPHAFSVVEVDFANVDVVRTAKKNEWKAQHGFSLTYLPFIARAIIDGLAEFPHLNASVSDGELIVHNFIDLGIAVDLDYEGLLAPVVRDADTKRLGAIASEISDLADRARNRKLTPDEISGGTFTISNNGSAGSVLTMPIINQPQVGIISTDAIVRKPVVTKGPDGGEAIAIHPVGQPRDELGSPRVRWCLRRRLPQEGQADPRDEGLEHRVVNADRYVRGQTPDVTTDAAPLRVRWLGRVPYREALAVQQSLFEHGSGQHLLLLEHPHVFTYGRTADLATNLKSEPAGVGAELVAVKRGGDITYHGPGQLVGYPILNVENSLGATDHVCGVEGLIIDVLGELGVSNAGRLAGIRRRVARSGNPTGSARSAPSASGCVAGARCTGSRSMSPPTSPTCVSTSSRVESATSRSRRSPKKASMSR